MNEKVLRETIQFLQQRSEEYIKKILDEKIEWEGKEFYYVKMKEDLLILGKLLEREVVIKTNVVW